MPFFSNIGPVFPGVNPVEFMVWAEAPISKGECQARMNPKFSRGLNSIGLQ